MKKKLIRSVLYMPSLDINLCNKGGQLGSDVIVLDLEDSVPQNKKGMARDICYDFFKKKHSVMTAIRINSLHSLDGINDIQCITNLDIMPEIIIMTKVDHAEEIALLRDILKSCKKETMLFITIETPDSLFNIESIASQSDGFIFGSADYAASLGVEITWENMLQARFQIVNACAKYDLYAIDTGCYSINSIELLEEECERTKSLGFCGKAAIHPSQISIINDTYTHTKEQLLKAHAIIDAYEKSNGTITKLNGDMIGPPFVALAKKIIAKY